MTAINARASVLASLIGNYLHRPYIHEGMLPTTFRFRFLVLIIWLRLLEMANFLICFHVLNISCGFYDYLQLALALFLSHTHSLIIYILILFIYKFMWCSQTFSFPLFVFYKYLIYLISYIFSLAAVNLWTSQHEYICQYLMHFSHFEFNGCTL